MDTLARNNSESWLVWFLRGVLVLGIGLMMARSLELQVIKGDYFRELAEGNRIKRITILAPRGRILARGGEELVGNILKETRANSPVSEWERNYILGSGFAHAGGYVGEVNEGEVARIDGVCPEKGPRHLGSLVGRSGLEESYECRLRGIDGEELVEVDTRGKNIRTLGVRKPVPGSDLQTTIDFSLQKKTAEIVGDIKNLKSIKLTPGTGHKGAVVLTDPKGEIFAFYSFPSFDPKDVVESLDDPNLPLFDRVVGGAYHPGSTFKIVTAVAALEERNIDRAYRYEDTGKISVNEFEYTNWFFTQYGRTEGSIDLIRAIARSTDTFFYKLGELVGPETLAKWAFKMGLGQKTGIDIPGEIEGLIPTPQWKEETKNEKWFLGNTYHMAIGQGDVTTTPMQVNALASVIANKGKLCKPLFVSSQWPVSLSLSDRCKDLNLAKETLDTIIEGMVGVCTTGGTAFPFFDWNGDSSRPKVACKTGTAETFDEGRTHAWFTMFAPAAAPEIVATVLVENGGEGSYAAAPVARAILDHWNLERNP